jgi:hypothetical protein
VPKAQPEWATHTFLLKINTLGKKKKPSKQLSGSETGSPQAYRVFLFQERNISNISEIFIRTK